jgi:cytidylate kinase
MIITIDGPAGSGKSTAARRLAKALGIAYLDTGATFRAVTLRAMKAGIDLADEATLLAIAREAAIELQPADDGLRVLLDGEDVSRQIRTQAVTANAFYAARSPAVRAELAELQRRIGQSLGSFVTEGRDQGSVVFPAADVKFFLDASPEVRARRRCDELLAAGERADYDHVLQSIRQRDERDRARAVAPLVVPRGAVAIDTSAKTIEQTTAEMLRHVEARP